MDHMRPPQRIVPAIFAMALAVAVVPERGAAQPEESTVGEDIEAVEPLLPPGISDFNLELYGKLAYTWVMADGTRVVEIQGEFAARMGEHELNSRDAVVWFKPQSWRDRTYLDVEVYLWQGARVRQPGGTIETGPVVLVTLRTFGKLILNADSRAAVGDAESELFQQGLRARRLLQAVPPEAAETSQTPVEVAPTLERLRLIRPKVRKMVTYSADQTSHLQYGDPSVGVSIGSVLVRLISTRGFQNTSSNVTLVKETGVSGLRGIREIPLVVNSCVCCPRHAVPGL